MKTGGFWKSIFCFFVMVSVMWGTTAFAVDRYVNQETGVYRTIQDAITAADPGDVVFVAPRVYIGEGNVNLLIDKAITIKSEKGPEGTTIDCGGTGRAFTFSGPGADGAVLSGFTIIQGTVQQSTSTVYSGYGGAILCLTNSSVLIEDCVFSQNSATYGGAIACIQSSPTISRCVIENNRAAAGGGGVACTGSSSPTIIACSITPNQAEMGGGVYLDYFSSPAFFSCLIACNSATFAGGGLFCSYNSSPNITHCTVSDNLAPSDGTEGYGGGILIYLQSSPIISNSIFWGNKATTGSELCLFESSSLNISYSDVHRGDQDSQIFVDNSLINWNDGNIQEDPDFLGEGDYHLSPNSPCIDAGTEQIELPEGMEDVVDFNFDIDWQSRVMGSAPDMGADEFVPKATVIQVEIDINPGCHHVKINLKSRGVLAVAVKTTKDFHARSIDPKTVVFAGAAPIGYTRHDIDRDRDKDMVFFFKIKKLNLDEDSTEATLSGKTKEGKPFKGTSKVNIEKPKCKAWGWPFGRR
jgi:predicted outer membrane repeat protein